jgi:hypothetical protein
LYSLLFELLAHLAPLAASSSSFCLAAAQLDPSLSWSDHAETWAESGSAGECEHQLNAPAKLHGYRGCDAYDLAQRLITEFWRAMSGTAAAMSRLCTTSSKVRVER